MTEEVTAPLEVDRESLLELARGANIYTGRLAFVRELIQNAIDATLLRVFAENGPDAFPTNPRSLVDLRARLQDYPIDVSMRRVDGSADVYRFVVEDRGTGIAAADRAHMQRIGSSRKNPARAAAIDAMPQWMRPSGAFGIGLQSVFLAADELRLSTRHMDGHAVELVLRSRDGDTITTRPGTKSEVGTRVEVDVVNQACTWARAQRQFDRPDVDPLDAGFDWRVAEARDAVAEMAFASLPPVRFDRAEVMSSWIEDAEFDVETMIEVALPTTDDNVPDPGDFRRRRLVGFPRHFYRCAPLLGCAEPLPVLPWRWNAHCGTARELLTLGRDNLSAAGRDHLLPRLEGILARRLPALVRSLEASGAAPRLLAFYSEYLFELGLDGAGTAWKDVAIGVRGTYRGDPITLGELAEVPWVELSEGQPRLPSGEELVLRSGSRALSRLFPGVRIDGASVRRTREPDIVVEESAVEHVIRRGGEKPLRPDIPIPDQFARLRQTPVKWQELWFSREQPWLFSPAPWVISEGVVSAPRLREWVAFIAECREEDAGAHAEIIESLAEFFRRFDPVLRARPDVRVDFELEEVLAEIRAIADGSTPP